MLMAELTYTLLQNSPNGSDRDLALSLMLEDVTRMSSTLTRHLRRATTMRSKMAMLSLGGSSDLAEEKFLQLVMDGATLQWRTLESSFFNYFLSMTHEVWCVRFPPSPNMPTGSTKWLRSRIDTTLPISSYREAFLDFLIGYDQTCKNMPLVVSISFLAAPVARAPYGS